MTSLLSSRFRLPFDDKKRMPSRGKVKLSEKKVVLF